MSDLMWARDKARGFFWAQVRLVCELGPLAEMWYLQAVGHVSWSWWRSKFDHYRCPLCSLLFGISMREGRERTNSVLQHDFSPCSQSIFLCFMGEQLENTWGRAVGVLFYTLAFNVTSVKAGKNSHRLSSSRALWADSHRFGAIIVSWDLRNG